ncbi:MAG: XrtA-associated tyrosine autokinase [Burkholderiaceae bacterium]|nr:XrtA-associated tyrosine autokinase [Burkholderiaceae bacterium]
MSLIEKAARRLDELRRAGIEVPAVEAPVTGRESARSAAATNGAATLDAVVAGGLPQSIVPRAVAVDARSPFLGESPVRRSREVVLDLARLAAQGYVTPDSPRSQLADEFRVLKRPVLNNAHGKSAAPIRRANLIMITSSLPGEGKTFTSINLALSIAMEVDSTVLLVDADVARPAVLDRLGLPSSPGLLDLLTQPELEFADVLLRTNVERLSILPAGTPHSRATELLASTGMSRLLDEMANRYPDRILVFDAPPLLLSTESRALATQVGQVLMVVEADRTTQSTVTTALGMIESCPVVMTILNKIDASQSGGGYYGQYGEYGA